MSNVNSEEAMVMVDAPEENEVLTLMNDIVNKIKVTSRFMCVATNQMGKTNAIMHLMRAIMEQPEYVNDKIRMRAFDPAFNFRFKFDSVPYVDRTECVHVPDDAQSLIVDIPFLDSKSKKDAIMEVLLSDFIRKRNMKKIYNGKIAYHNFYIVDEMQNVWGNYALRSREGEGALTVFSESSNYGMSIMGISQRFADVATGIVERCAYYLVGALSGSNELTRLGKMVSDVKIVKRVRTLKRGEFIFIDKDNSEYFTEIHFPIFVGNGKPYPYQSPTVITQTNKVGKIQAFKNFF
jgi:hypothetical protein